MKKIIIVAALVVSSGVFSQVIIGDAVGTAPAASKTSVLLEFANTGDKGIVLPYVRSKSSAPTEGSIILDVSNPADARVKFYNNSGSADKWADLSGQGADLSATTSVLSSQPTVSEVTESADTKTIIGATSSPVTDGVLVLESNTKALVLPHVADVNDVKNPSPGMLVYVNKAGAKRLAVFNGSKWSFWAPPAP